MGMLINSYTGSAGGATSTSTLTIASGHVGSNLTNYPVYVNLADLGSGFWSAVASDGGNMRVKQSGSDVPFDVVKIDTSGHTGAMFFLASSLLAASSNVFTIETASGLTMPAVGASNGRNAVWAAFDWVWLGASVSGGTPELVDRTGGTVGTITNGVFSDTPIALGAGCGILNTSLQPKLNWPSRAGRTQFTLGVTMRLDVSSITPSFTALAYSTNGTTRMGVAYRDNGASDAINIWDQANSWMGGTPPLLSANNGVARRVHAVYDGSTSRKRYIDGAINDTSGAITARPGTDVDYTVFNNPSGNEPFTGGYLAFAYARPQILSADYLAAEYSNLNAPTSFYAIT